jgi:signal transduction histidine kinase
LTPVAIRVLQTGWIAVEFVALVFGIVATPALARRYQTVCDVQICSDLLPRPNQHTIDVLARLGVSLHNYAILMVALDWLYPLLWGAVGAVVMLRRPRDPVALLVAYAGCAAAYSSFALAYEAAHPDVDLPSRAVTFGARILGPLLLGLFPNGRWVPRWTRWIAAAGVVWATIIALVGQPLPPLVDDLDAVGSLLLWGILIGAQIYRYRRVSQTIERQQTTWLLYGVALYVGNAALVMVAWPFGLAGRYQLAFVPLCYGGSAALAITIGIAILRYRLFAIDVVLNRTLVYTGLTAGLVGVYALIVGGLGTLLRARGEPVIAILAAGLIALLFAPFRDRLQRAANRLVYGNRDEPYAVLTRLGRRLEASLDPETVLPSIVETVGAALKLPYAAIALHQGDGGLVATYGTSPVRPPVAVPLVYQGAPIGDLLLAPRTGETALSRADRRLVDDLAAHAGVAAHAVRLTRDLQQARERLVAAREEERRRLRRDLHDGLGPILASQALTIDAARALMTTDPTTAETLLLDLKSQGQTAVADVRRLVYALRPPALDDLGLVAAIRQEATPYERTGLRVTVEAPDPLPPLPAAVEVAAFRIAQEALTNAVRHADAHTCTITLFPTDHPPSLFVEIADDGRGLPSTSRAGVGTASMRERAEELGGSFGIEQHPAGGVRVSARLPVPRED